MVEFSKVKLRTKAEVPVVSADLDRRELIFSNLEQVLFLKDLNGNILTFMPVDDTGDGLSVCWSAYRIKQEFLNFLDFYLDVIDGGSF